MTNTHIRYERKIHLEQLSEDQILSFIKTHPYGFKEIYYKRQVNSLYFDTPSLDSFWDNELGASNRAKIRVRWYGKDIEIPKDKSQLEIKIKKGSVGDKIITAWEPLTDLKIKSLIKNTKPMILVSYQRQYFQSYDKKFRVTLDSEIEYRKSNDLRTENQTYKDYGFVLEIKYEKELDSEVNKIVKYLPGRVTKFSKYARGITRAYGN